MIFVPAWVPGGRAILRRRCVTPYGATSFPRGHPVESVRPLMVLQGVWWRRRHTIAGSGKPSSPVSQQNSYERGSNQLSYLDVIAGRIRTTISLVWVRGQLRL